MRNDWEYSHAAHSQCGTMMCNACRKKITGQYRYRDTDDGFIVQHRDCSSFDPKWEQIDAKEQELRDRNTQLLNACIEFRDKWKVTDLDELIENLEDFDHYSCMHRQYKDDENEKDPT